MSKSKPKVIFSKQIDTSLRGRVLNSLENATSIDNNGQVTWGIEGEVQQHISILRDAFEFPNELSGHECAGLVWRGLFDARKKGALTDSSVMEEVQRNADANLAQSVRRYSMWSQISYEKSAAVRTLKFKFDDVEIRLTSQLPSYMHLSAGTLSNLGHLSVNDNNRFGYLVAVTTARNEAHAADKIFRATEMVQSVYNLALKSWNIFGSEQKPEALMLMGSHHFLYRDKKPLYPEHTWYNPNFREEFWTSTPRESKTIFTSAKTVRKALKALEHHPLKDPISTAFLMMNDGMQSADMSHRTLRYWTAIERLFQAGDERASYEKIIKRATYLDDADSLAGAKLSRLVRIRNRYVHMGTAEN